MHTLGFTKNIFKLEFNIFLHVLKRRACLSILTKAILVILFWWFRLYNKPTGRGAVILKAFDATSDKNFVKIMFQFQRNCIWDQKYWLLIWSGCRPNAGALCNTGYPSKIHIKRKSHKISFAHNVFLSCPVVLKFCTEHGSITVQIFKTIGEIKWMLWTNEISRDLIFRQVSDGYQLYCTRPLNPNLHVLLRTANACENCRATIPWRQSPCSWKYMWFCIMKWHSLYYEMTQSLVLLV